MTNAEKIAQIRSEYEEGRTFLETKKLRWVDQLKLLNNLARGSETIASTMMFSYFTRVVGNLYEPKKQVKFVANEETELKNAETLNKLSDSDFQDMDMETIEYDWTWDAGFFARGYLEMLYFDKKNKIPRPEVINPLAFQYDPMFPKVKDWRYYDKWITKSEQQIQAMIESKIITGIKSPKDITSGMDPEFWNYKVLREVAKLVTSQGPDSMTPTNTVGNGIYQILEHYTYFEGKKNVVWTDRAITKILREEVLDLGNDPESPDGTIWPIVIREVFREPHSSFPVSVPDLIEDKHRAKNVVLNLGFIAVKDEATPIYVAKTSALTNPSQLTQRQIMQHILIEDEANVNDAIAPLKKNIGLSNSAMTFLSLMGSEASEAIGTVQVNPAAGKGGGGKKSATGDALMQQILDLTASLQTRIIGKSEKDFWSMYYMMYIKNIKDGDAKILAITNSQFTTFETIQLNTIKGKKPPKQLISGSRDAEYKETIERRELAQQLPTLQGILSPQELREFMKFVWFPKFQTFDTQTIDLIFPKSLDELKAEEENLMISDGKLPPISETDDHAVHLYIHSRVKNNREKWAHVLTHEALLAKQKKQQEQQAQQQQGQEEQGGQNKNAPQMGKPDKKSVNTKEAAAPAKGMAEKQNSSGSKISNTVSK